MTYDTQNIKYIWTINYPIRNGPNDKLQHHIDKKIGIASGSKYGRLLISSSELDVLNHHGYRVREQVFGQLYNYDG